jgi:hypothetical protein
MSLQSSMTILANFQLPPWKASALYAYGIGVSAGGGGAGAEIHASFGQNIKISEKL